MADDEERVGEVEIAERAGLTVGTEALAQRRGGRRGAQPRVPVHVRGAQPGFADDGERVSVVTFANQEAQSAWRDHPDHRVAQQLGRSNFYDSYDIQICRVVSERSFRRQVLTEGVNAER